MDASVVALIGVIVTAVSGTITAIIGHWFGRRNSKDDSIIKGFVGVIESQKALYESLSKELATAKADQTELRREVECLREAQDMMRDEWDLDRAWTRILQQHIRDQLPPPPPNRPTTLS